MEQKERIEKYPTISNKTVRKNENYLATYFHKEGGKLQKTNRGFFLDGRNISGLSATAWLAEFGVVHNGVYRPAKVYRKRKDPRKSDTAQWEQDEKAARARRRNDRAAHRALAVGPTEIPKGDW